ncbi:MAG TPA: methyltransferase domain-containing protein [Candidatus Eremiobacteraceae bacterium]|nr:methyltransferase domain-containing protein [Candidatus Eremiobacteraceae bacterium]
MEAVNQRYNRFIIQGGWGTRNLRRTFANMPKLSDEESNVARHYDHSVFEDELTRLPQECPVEMAVTLRWLGRVVKAGDLVAEIGVGGGHYTEFLARRSCRLHLVDVSARLLDAVSQKLRKAGLADSLAGCHHASGTRLEGLQSESLDLVLLMGPLYHLRSLEGRQRSVLESARILKKGGTLFAAGINRLSYLRDLLRFKFAPVSERVAFHQQYLRDGNLDPEHAPPIGWAHLTTAAEFLALFEEKFEPTAFLGVESFTTAWQKTFRELPAAEAELWLDLVEATNQTPEEIAQSDHFLFIGRKL